MNATMANQIVSISVSHLDRCFRSLFDLSAYQEEKQDSKHRVHTHESQQGEDPVASRDQLRIAIGGAHQRVHQPGLPAQFGGHPSSGIGDVGEWQREEQYPEHPSARKEPAAPEQ